MKIFIHVKSLGKKQKALTPVAYEITDNMLSLKEFLKELVRIEVEKYNSKEAGKQQLLFLTAEEIENQAEIGKVGFDGAYSDKKADVQKAIVNALQCYEDGLIRVFQGEKELKDLGEELQIQEGDTFTLIRLTFLAGRMW